MTARNLALAPLLALSLLTAGPAAAREPKMQVVQLAVTKAGFEPASVTVKSGAPVKLVVTRKVERTCATEIVMKDLGVEKALPLNEPVSVVVKPARPGAYRFACSMDMIGGTLKVE